MLARHAAGSIVALAGGEGLWGSPLVEVRTFATRVRSGSPDSAEVSGVHRRPSAHDDSLVAMGIKTVAMECTGVYWVRVYEGWKGRICKAKRPAGRAAMGVS